MNSAVIRLSKRLIIDSGETHPELRQMWYGINESIEDLIRRRGGMQRLNWKTMHNRYRQDFNRDASDYGQSTLQLLAYRFPDDTNLTTQEREIKIESAQTEIRNFTEEPNSLQIHYFLITEQLIIIDSIADCLLLAKKELLQAFLNGEVLQNTFTINLNNNYDIVEYSKPKLEN